MRAIPIDSFFEDLDERRGSSPATGAVPTAYDWRRIVAEGRAARASADGGRWRIGGLALLVERRYASGALQRFADAIGEPYGTVRRYRWVAKAYDASSRARFEGLSFSHFQAVAGLPDRLGWLERAVRGGWSVDRLARESRASAARQARSDAATNRDPLRRLRSSVDGMRRWLGPTALLDDVALAEAGRTWLAEALNELVEEVARLKERVHRATKAADAPRSAKVARYRADARKPKRTGTRKAGDADVSRSRTAALKARAVGR